MRPQQNSTNKTFWLAIGILSLGLTFWALSPSDTSSSTSTKKQTRKSTTSTSSTEADIQPEDYKVKFTTLAAPAVDVFKPAVYHKQAAGAAANQQNAIPPEYASGEADWTFTGTAEINNVSEANFQNDKLGQFAQVERGQKWKTSVVSQITPTYVMLVSDSGDTKKVLMPADVVTEAPKTAVTPANATIAPLNPAISGPIGADTTTTQTTNDNGAGMQQQFGGGFGGRRGRGGGRRGRGGMRFGGGG